MKRDVYVVCERNHKVLGVAEHYTGVVTMLMVNKWITPQEANWGVLKPNRKNFEKKLKQNFGITFEKKLLW